MRGTVEPGRSAEKSNHVWACSNKREELLLLLTLTKKESLKDRGGGNKLEKGRRKGERKSVVGVQRPDKEGERQKN